MKPQLSEGQRIIVTLLGFPSTVRVTSVREDGFTCIDEISGRPAQLRYRDIIATDFANYIGHAERRGIVKKIAKNESPTVSAKTEAQKEHEKAMKLFNSLPPEVQAKLMSQLKGEE